MIEHANTIHRGGAHTPTPSGPYPMGLMSLLATVTMLFAAFTAAILVRRTGIDWQRIELPFVVWVNTGVLVLSSVWVERARGSIKRDLTRRAVAQLQGAAVLGTLFLAGQLVAWYALLRQGVFLPTNPHASFFYMLSAVHGAHVLGGVGALAWTLRRARQGSYAPKRYVGLAHAATYWHFVGIVWLYLMALLITL